LGVTAPSVGRQGRHGIDPAEHRVREEHRAGHGCVPLPSEVASDRRYPMKRHVEQLRGWKKLRSSGEDVRKLPRLVGRRHGSHEMRIAHGRGFDEGNRNDQRRASLHVGETGLLSGPGQHRRQRLVGFEPPVVRPFAKELGRPGHGPVGVARRRRDERHIEFGDGAARVDQQEFAVFPAATVRKPLGEPPIGRPDVSKRLRRPKARQGPSFVVLAARTSVGRAGGVGPRR